MGGQAARRMVVGVTAGTLTLGLAGCEPPPTADWDSVLVSVNADGTLGANGRSGPIDISPDGTLVLFSSSARDLGFPGTPQPGADVYLGDTVTGDVSRITSSPGGTGANGLTQMARFSPDGTRVVLVTGASNLGPTDANNTTDVYLHDIATATTSLVSSNSAGTGSGNGMSSNPWFSPDGRRIAFQSTASDLGPPDTNNSSDVFVRDLDTGVTTLVSTDASGTRPGTGGSVLSGGGFSADGTRIAFESLARDLVASTPGNGNNVFMRDLATGTTTLASVTDDGKQLPGDGASLRPWISPDGTKVAFQYLVSDATVPPPQPPFRQEIYLRDLSTGTTSLVTRGDAGAANGGSSPPVFAPDGRTVAFNSFASNLVLGDDNGQQDAFIYDVDDGSLHLVSIDATGATSATGISTALSYSADGRSLTFSSTATDVVSDHPTAEANIYLRRLDLATTDLVSLTIDGTSGAGAAISSATAAPISADGGAVAFASASKALAGAHPGTGTQQVYVARVTPFSTGDLAVAIDAPSDVTSGGAATLTVTATNAGPGPVAGTTLAHVVSAGVGPVTATTSAGTCAVAQASTGDQVVTCALGTLREGDAVEVVITGPVIGDAGTTLTATSAIAASRHAEPDAADNAATTLIAVN